MNKKAQLGDDPFYPLYLGEVEKFSKKEKIYILMAFIILGMCLALIILMRYYGN